MRGRCIITNEDLYEGQLSRHAISKLIKLISRFLTYKIMQIGAEHKLITNSSSSCDPTRHKERIQKLQEVSKKHTRSGMEGPTPLRNVPPPALVNISKSSKFQITDWNTNTAHTGRKACATRGLGHYGVMRGSNDEGEYLLFYLWVIQPGYQGQLELKAAFWSQY